MCFLDKLQPVSFKEELHHWCFIMTFARFWRTFLNSLFKEIASNRKTEWKESKVIKKIENYSSVKRTFCSSLIDLDYKK